MYRSGREEIDAIGDVLPNGTVFRYGIGNACTRFEERYGKCLGVNHFMLAASGTTALTAARMGCLIECRTLCWTSREQNESLFIRNGPRASEIEGAVLNVQHGAPSSRTAAPRTRP